jgi:hypothetical protein
MKKHLVALGFALVLATLGFALDATLALRTIDRLTRSEGYPDKKLQNVMIITDTPIRF